MPDNNDWEITTDIEESAPGFHRLFQQLFSSQRRNEDGNRLLFLLYLETQGPISDREHREELKDVLRVSTRQGYNGNKKTLIDAGLVQEVRSNVIDLTSRGERVIESLRVFAEDYNGDLDETIEKDIEGPYYSKLRLIVYTNGSEYSDYLWSFELQNESDQEIATVTDNSAGSGGSSNEGFSLQHSNSIEDYRVTTDLGDQVIFDIEFNRAIKPGESRRYWYSYRWPRNYKPSWGKEWSYTYKSRGYPVRDLRIEFINRKSIDVERQSLFHNVEKGSESELGRFRTSGAELSKTSDFNIVSIEAQNLSSGTTVEFGWDFSHRPEQ